MKQIKNYIFSIICLSGLIWSCSTETESLDDSTFGYQYYPLAIGKVWEYRKTQQSLITRKKLKTLLEVLLESCYLK